MSRCSRKARKSLGKFVNKEIVLFSSFYIDVVVTFRISRQQRHIVVKTTSNKQYWTLIHFPNFSFFPNFNVARRQITKKSVLPQLIRGRDGLLLNEIKKKKNQKIMNFFKSFKVINRGCGSKITHWNKTLGLHFQISNPTFSLSLSHFEGVPRSCSQLYNMLLYTLFYKGQVPYTRVFCVCIITKKLTSFENFTIRMDVSNACIQSLYVIFFLNFY